MWNHAEFNPEKHSLADWVRISGGIKPSPVTRDAEEIRHICSRKENGYNLINYARGQSLDTLCSGAIEVGFLPYHAGHDDFLNLLGTDVQAKVSGQIWCRAWHPSKACDDIIESLESSLTDDFDFANTLSCSSCGNPEAETLYIAKDWQDVLCDDCLDMLEGVCS